jgi:hypothetical protein
MPGQQLSGLNATGSLTAFYDEIVFWEMYKNTNRFFVTFEKGKYGILNNQRESIGTMEIDYPHTLAQTSSIKRRVHPFAPRGSKAFNFFLEEEEIGKNPTADTQNNGHISITQLKGNRSYKTVITSSIFKPVSCSYKVYIDNTNTQISSRILSASYFWPFTQYQLSVLRENETLILNLNKPEELPQGLGEKGFALIPENTSKIVKDNLEYFLEKAGLIDKTTRTFINSNPEGGGGRRKIFAGGVGQGSDLGLANSVNNDEDEEEIGEDTDNTDSPGGLFGGGLFGPGGFNPDNAGGGTSNNPFGGGLFGPGY